MNAYQVLETVDEHRQELVDTINGLFNQAEVYNYRLEAAEGIRRITPKHTDYWRDIDAECTDWEAKWSEAYTQAISLLYKFESIVAAVSNHRAELERRYGCRRDVNEPNKD